MKNRHGRILFAQLLPPIPKQKPLSRPKFKIIQIEPKLPNSYELSMIFAVPADIAQRDLEVYQRAVYARVVLDRMGRIAA